MPKLACTQLLDSAMNEVAAQDLHLIDFSIGVTHTISTGMFENIKVEARITCGVRRGTTDEQFKVLLAEAERKLKEIIIETYNAQKRPKRQAGQTGD
jgi:hypothetical protein